MFNPPRLKLLISGILVFLLVLFTVENQVSSPNQNGGIISSGEDALWDLLNECTTGLASGAATADGRPLLWKNRDVSNSNQEFHYVDDGRIPFISITYSGEDDEYYGGINAAGFAVENSNSYNLIAGPNGNGWGYGDDDGEIHMLALATCRTVDDFQALMDSTNVDGRTLNCNYGTFDAYGGAAMFETGGESYTRVDADDTPDGIIIRANYSYSGRDLDNRPAYWGPNRHDTALELWKWAVDNGELTAKYVFQNTIRNLHVAGMDDYDMPYNGFWDDYPYGYIPNGEAICRTTTRGILVAQGVRNGENPDDAILWAMAGTPLGSVATPLWVRAGSVPVEYDGVNSRLCNAALRISGWVYPPGYSGRAVDTWRLVNPNGTGYWDWAVNLENWVFEKTDQFVNSPQFDYDQLENFQNQIAQQVADSIETWNPYSSPTEISELVFFNNHIVIRWGETIEGELIEQNIRPTQYTVYRADQPFRENIQDEPIASVRNRYFVDENPLPGRSFYRVEATY